MKSSRGTGQMQLDLMTSAPSESTTSPMLTSSRAAFLARTSLLLARAKVSMGHARDFGGSMCASFARWRPESSSWRMYRRFGDEDFTPYSGTWPRSGMIVGGIAYRLPPSAPLTEGTDYSSWPTATASDDGKMGRYAQGGIALSAAARTWPTPATGDSKKLGETPEKWLRRSAANQAKGVHRQYPLGVAAQTGMDEAQIKREWPTPTVTGNWNRKGASSESGDGLVTAVKQWPTPCASDSAGPGLGKERQGGGNLRTEVRAQWATPIGSDFRSGKASAETMSKNARPLREQVVSGNWPTPNATDFKGPGNRRSPDKIRDSTDDDLPSRVAAERNWPTPTASEGANRNTARCPSHDEGEVGGSLNPVWVEMLMGFPPGWTEVSRQDQEKIKKTGKPRARPHSRGGKKGRHG